MKKKVLVVDDDECILMLLGFILSEEFDVIFKRNALEALYWLEEGNHPALIISDLRMPHIDGLAFLKNLRVSGYYKNVPVIILSAALNLAHHLKDIDFQVSDYLEKPFDPTVLKAMVNKLLNKYTRDAHYQLAS